MRWILLDWVRYSRDEIKIMTFEMLGVLGGRLNAGLR